MTEQARGEKSAGRRDPRAGSLAAWGLALLAAVGLATSVPALQSLARGSLFPGMLEMTLGGLFLSLLPLALIPGVARERRWAWSAAGALAAVRALGGAAGLAWQLSRLPDLLSPASSRTGFAIRAVILREMPWTLARGVLLTLTAVLLFALLYGAREQFGVDLRRPWSTLLREGWWMLLLAGGPQAVGVLWILLTSWRL